MPWSRILRPGARYSIRACIKCGARTQRIKRGKHKPRLPAPLAEQKEKIKVADELWRKWIYAKSPNGICVLCLKKRPIQAAHFISRWYKHTRHDQDNGAPLCGGCHMLLGKDHELHRLFFRQYLGPATYRRLEVARLQRGKVDLDLAILNLRALLETK